MKKGEVLAQKYKDDNRIKFYLLNIPVLKDTIGEAQQVLKNRQIHLPALYAMEKSSWDSLKIKGVPVYLFIKNKKIIASHTGIGDAINKSPLKPSLENDMLKIIID